MLRLRSTNQLSETVHGNQESTSRLLPRVGVESARVSKSEHQLLTASGQCFPENPEKQRYGLLDNHLLERLLTVGNGSKQGGDFDRGHG